MLFCEQRAVHQREPVGSEEVLGSGPVEHSQIPQIVPVSLSDCHCLRDLNVRLDAIPLSGLCVLVHTCHHHLYCIMFMFSTHFPCNLCHHWDHHFHYIQHLQLTALALSAMTLFVASTASSRLLYSDSASSFKVSFCCHRLSQSALMTKHTKLSNIDLVVLSSHRENL